jgi:N-acetylglucosaminyldiphosphoundecaprenol N-acetyl-beta-D-mannosaminyltransferase
MSLAGVPRDERTNILGVCINSINLDDAVATIERWISDRSQNYVCVTDVHGLMEGRSDERLRSIYNEAGMATPDGMPLVWFPGSLAKAAQSASTDPI